MTKIKVMLECSSTVETSLHNSKDIAIKHHRNGQPLLNMFQYAFYFERNVREVSSNCE